MNRLGQKRNIPLVHHFLIGVLALLAASLPVRAVDGVIEIDQAIALSGGVTPTDAAGFPVTIDQSGSYNQRAFEPERAERHGCRSARQRR